MAAVQREMKDVRREAEDTAAPMPEPTEVVGQVEPLALAELIQQVGQEELVLTREVPEL